MLLRKTLKPGDLGYVIYLHGMLYAREYALDHTFEGDVVQRMGEFMKSFDGEKDLFAIAEDAEGNIVGSIAINGHADNTAQLRWFLLHPSARGAGLGKQLLQEAIDFCKERKFKSVFLWTISELTTAAHLYREAGFELTWENTREFWGGMRTEQRYDLILK
ncbi:MAG: N-acetyltransferase [Acidobacteria bacterium]|nr:MAG: N-acetyltransferase [Acidobacteriota bacterium]